mmetsp:Transcript_50142/g.122370  ORF Transcript_50142/g.122370 Transcript_50142/m.122370 type:complete len:211 (-) Transcript_50142:70-702(-)
MLGGSPIIVAVPKRLEKMASEIRKGRGSMSTSLHSLHVTGVISKIVVTLSRKAESTPVTRQRRKLSRLLLPPLSLHATTPSHSNTPVRTVIPTMSIIPHSRPSVPWSIQPTTVDRLGTRFCKARASRAKEAPIIADMVRWITSDMISPNTNISRNPAIHTSPGPSHPSDTKLSATGRGRLESVETTKSEPTGLALRRMSRSLCDSFSSTG